MSLKQEDNSTKVAFFLAYNSLKRGSKKTTILTIFLMAIVAVNIIFLPSIISGIGQSLIQSSIDFSYGNLYIEPLEGKDYIENVNSLLKKIERTPGIISVTSRYNVGATITYEKKNVGINIKSMNPEREETVTKFQKRIISGDYLSENDREKIFLGYAVAGDKETGEQLADSLGGAEVGEKVTVTYSNGVSKNYTVKGIFSADLMAVDWMVFISEKEMESILNIEDKASEIIIKTAEKDKEVQYRNQLLSIGVKEQIKTVQEKVQDAVKNILDSLTFLTVMTFFISLAIAITVLFIITYINTINKKRQIGILKAIGINQKTIILSYVFAAFFYAFLGMVIGAIILVIILSYLTSNPLPFPTGELIPITDMWAIWMGIFCLTVAALFSGFFPSWRIARKDILEQIWGPK